MTPPSLSHIGIIVPDLEAAIGLFASHFNLAPGPILVNEAQGVRLVQFDLGNARVELLTPLHSEGPIATFLTRNPKGGLHHLALATDDLSAALYDLEQHGVSPIAAQSVNVLGRPFAFLRPGDHFGVLVELEGS
jgi:methylmalonyl-CoA/ethylmalonyl-CoA epimerase